MQAQRVYPRATSNQWPANKPVPHEPSTKQLKCSQWAEPKEWERDTHEDNGTTKCNTYWPKREETKPTLETATPSTQMDTETPPEDKGNDSPPIPGDTPQKQNTEIRTGHSMEKATGIGNDPSTHQNHTDASQIRSTGITNYKWELKTKPE